MKRWIIVGLLALVAGILHVQIVLSSWGERVEPWAADLWSNVRGTLSPPPDIAIISMDETSYSILDLPMDKAWPRALHAQLLEKLAEYGVKRVIFDVLFIGPGSDPEGDKKLAASVGLVPTVLGVDSGVRELGGTGGRYTMEELLTPLDDIAEKAEQLALVRMPEDFGYVRRFAIPRSLTTKDIPTLNEAAAGVKHDDPTLPGERDMIWYYGPPGTITTYPYHVVLNPKGQLPKEALQNKIVFVGLNLRTEIGPAQKDTYRTPFFDRGSMFGVEIQANATANLMTHQWVSRASALRESIVLFLMTVLMTFSIFAVRPQWAGLLLIAYTVLWLAASYVAFLNGFFIPGVFLLGFILPFSYLGSTLVYYLVTHRSQQQVERAFQFYLSPEMAKQMRDNPQGLKLGGESVYATAMFTDIAGFTDITEQMNASEVSTMLNAYFTEVMDVVFQKQGTLIKFIGDAVFVIWGAPIKIQDHAKLAAETGIAIQREVRKFNDSKRFPSLITRVGLHTGPMVVGNLGSSRRFDYTAIGDSVNLTSRLEGINKYFGTSVIISDATLREIGSGFTVVTMGNIRVSGKKETIGIHALIETPLPTPALERWLKALTDFRNKRFDSAEENFVAAAEMEQFFGVAAELYRKEIAALRESGVPDDWQGEVTFKQK